MTVVCNIKDCGFYDNGFCRQKVLSINRGYCNFVFNSKGGINPDAANPIENEYKEKLTIIEGEEDNGVGCSERSININSKESENDYREYKTKE